LQHIDGACCQNSFREKIPWAWALVTGTGKKLELGLRKKYFGAERDSPERSGLGEPKGGSQGRMLRRLPVRVNPRAVRGRSHTPAKVALMAVTTINTMLKFQ